jgi:hypothetical protein
VCTRTQPTVGGGLNIHFLASVAADLRAAISAAFADAVLIEPLSPGLSRTRLKAGSVAGA